MIYGDHTGKVPQPVAQLPWGHNILLIEQVKNIDDRFWYAEQAIIQGWSRNSLTQMIKNNTVRRQGSAVTNFKKRLSKPQSFLAQQTLKDPYIFDFLTLPEPFKERELELGLLKHLEKFLLELGGGFSFVGRQYRIEISDKDFYIDLLFYHLKLRAFVVIDVKRGEFKPEYAGKMNFYCSVVDDKLRQPYLLGTNNVHSQMGNKETIEEAPTSVNEAWQRKNYGYFIAQDWTNCVLHVKEKGAFQ